MNTDLLKSAAACLEELLQETIKLEEYNNKHKLIEKIAKSYVDQQLISTFEEYFSKIAELETKSLTELQDIARFIEVIAPRIKQEFGKLANVSISNFASNMTAEEQFNQALLEVIK